MQHVRANLKREQLLEEKYEAIDRENRRLLHKMSTITRNPGELAAFMQQGQLGPPSLNKGTRQKELMRITKENQSILRRIQQAQPVYNHVEWEHNHQKNTALLNNCAEYPVVLRSARRKEVTSEMSPLFGGAVLDIGSAGDREVGDGMRYVWKAGQKISDAYYLVEMSTDGRILNVAAFDGESQATLELVVDESRHRSLFRESNGDYGVLAARLRVMDSKLVLDKDEAPTELEATSSTWSRSTPAASAYVDADAMVRKQGSATPRSTDTPMVEAQVKFSARGPRVQLRGLTP